MIYEIDLWVFERRDEISVRLFKDQNDGAVTTVTYYPLQVSRPSLETATSDTCMFFAKPFDENTSFAGRIFPPPQIGFFLYFLPTINT